MKTVEEIFNQMNAEIDACNKRYAEALRELREKAEHEGILNTKEYKLACAALNIVNQEELIEIKTPYTMYLYNDLKFNKTTEDISILLDLEPLFITRNLRNKHIKTIDIPTTKVFKYNTNIDYERKIHLSKKKFLYNQNDLECFIKNHLKKAEQYIYINLDEFKEQFEEEEIEDSKIFNLANEYLNIQYKILKKNKPLDYTCSDLTHEEFELIKSNEISLLRLDSLRDIVKRNILINKLKKLTELLKQNGANKDEIEKIQDKINDIKKSNFNKDLGKLKQANMVHQKQLERHINKHEHIKYYLKLSENTKIPVTLYGLTTRQYTVLNNTQEDNDDMKIAVKQSLLESNTNLKNELVDYIIKNKNKGIEIEIDDF